MRKTTAFRSSLNILAGMSLALATAANAQTAAAQDTELSEIVVVGSQIKGATAAGTLPVTVLSQERIEATGSVSGDDLFRSIPQASDVQFQESRTTGNLNDARGDNASINLRSVGTGNTLVLLNGRRMILTPGTQTENFVPVQTANTNSLPIGAVRRIEVLRDGAAAIYGADAVAGVVNVVTDDRYQGFRANARHGFADGTKETSVALKAGTSTRFGANFMAFGSYTHRTPLLTSAREFAASEDHRAGLVGTPWEGGTSFDNRSTSSPWGSFTVVPSTTLVKQGTASLTSTGAFHVEPVSNTAAGCSSTVYSGNLCLRSGGITGTTDRVLRYDENPDRTIRGGLDRVNVFGTYSQTVGKIELYGEAGYYNAALSGTREQSAPISSAVITIPATNYYNPFGATTINGVTKPNRLANLTGVPVTGLAIRITNYRPVDTGPRRFVVSDDMLHGLFGARGDWGKFSWDSALSYSWARTDDNTHNAISNTLFQQALALSTPDAYNPFNGGTQEAYSLGDSTANSRATINSFLVDVHRISSTSLAMADFKVSTPNLLALPAGGLGLASGVEVRRDTYTDNRDSRLDGTITYTDIVSGTTYGTDIMGASPSPDVRANRSVAAAFLEFAVPVVSQSMHVPLVRSFDLQLAARDEHYSDFGNVLKSKAAASWSVIEGVKFRSSWSQSFRAPNLAQFYSSGTQVSNTRTDYSACRLNNVTCADVSTLEVRSGNKNLSAEDAVTTSFGVVLQPYRGILLTADYWSLKEDGVIGLQGAQNQLLYDYLQRLGGKTNPNIVRIAPVGTQVVGDVSYVEDDYFNLGPRKLAGYDFGASYETEVTDYGKFSIEINASKLTKFEQSPSTLQQTLIDANNAGKLGTGIVITQAGSQIQVNGNPEWRYSVDLSWSRKALSAGALVNYVGPVKDTGPAQVNGQFYKLSSYNTLGLYGQYRVLDKNTAFSGMRARVGVRNLYDKAPPLSSSNYGFLGSLHDAVGRYIYLDLTKDF